MDYTIQIGDTLSGIAARFFGDAQQWRAIAQDNDLRSTSRLWVGEHLKLRDSLLPPAAKRAQPLATAPTGQGDLQHRPSIVPARAFVFVVADEVNPATRKVVRKVMVSQRLAAEVSTRIGRSVPLVPNPERFGLHPGSPHSPITMGRHAMNMKPSPFSSASNHSLGSSRFVGNRFWIDVDKARAAGATFHETEEIVLDLSRIAAKTRKPADLAKIEAFKRIVVADQEVLIRGVVPPAAVKGATAMAVTRGIQGIQIVGFVMTAADLGLAANKSVRVGSMKPIVAETIRQAGSWAATWAGIKLGAAGGALVGIETGPGAVLTGFAGAMVGGVGGYCGFDWIADHIDAN